MTCTNVDLVFLQLILMTIASFFIGLGIGVCGSKTKRHDKKIDEYLKER